MKQITVTIILMAMIPLIASIGIMTALPFAQAEHTGDTHDDQKYTSGFGATEDPKGDTSQGCKGGLVHLKDPNSGTILCVNQDKVQKYLNEGWIALDDIPSIKKGSAGSECKDGWVHLTNSDGEIICEKPNEAKKLVPQGWDASHAPHFQMDSGIPPHEVVCDYQKKLIIRDSGHGNCVTSSTHDKMLAAGIGAKAMGKECTTGFIHLKNPNTGAIICEKQSVSPKYIGMGWIALDKIPEMETTATIVCKGGEVKMTEPATGTIICKNQDEAQKYINEGWVVTGQWGATDPLIDRVQSSDIAKGDSPPDHIVKIQIIDVTRELESNAYYVTYKVIAGIQELEHIEIDTFSDSSKVTGIIDQLGARADTTLKIRINAIDASTIHGAVSNYNLK